MKFLTNFKNKLKYHKDSVRLSDRNAVRDIQLFVTLLQLNTDESVIFGQYLFISSDVFKQKIIKGMGFELQTIPPGTYLAFSDQPLYYNSQFNIAIHVIDSSEIKFLHYALDLTEDVLIAKHEEIYLLETSFNVIKRVK